MYDVMTHGSGDARKQPLSFLITTAGSDHNSICYEVHQKAEDILDGRKSDPAFYPVVYSAPDDADWTSEAVWRAVNPSLGVTVEIEKLRAACESAKQNPSEENLFRQLRLNQWRFTSGLKLLHLYSKMAFTQSLSRFYIHYIQVSVTLGQNDYD